MGLIARAAVAQVDVHATVVAHVEEEADHGEDRAANPKDEAGGAGCPEIRIPRTIANELAALHGAQGHSALCRREEGGRAPSVPALAFRNN
jgi:hypothetical protein